MVQALRAYSLLHQAHHVDSLRYQVLYVNLTFLLDDVWHPSVHAALEQGH
jgi:hypothetical protein